jgi:SRSO17 transposase
MVSSGGAWAGDLDRLHARIGTRFQRPEVRERARGYLGALIGRVERKNGWQLAEELGERTPDGVQRLLNAARWDADAVRDDLRGYVVEQLGSADGVLVVDETGFLKKGTKSAGVARQYSGTAGRIENAQVGVFLAYASEHGRAFLDRALYLPEEWTDDRPRCQAAAIPAEVGFATKLRLAQDMLARALDADVPAAWVTADEIYGNESKLRFWLQAREQGYVLAVSRAHRVWSLETGTQRRVETLITALAEEAWTRLAIGDGSKGPRVYAWTCLPLHYTSPDGWVQSILARRALADPTEIAYYRVFAPADTPVVTLARVAGTRWAIEECFERAKGEVGLDQYEVRRYDAWYRHITLCLLAHAYLAVARLHGAAWEQKGDLATT